MEGSNIDLDIGISTACFYPELTECALKKIADSGVKNTELFFNSESELTGPIFNNIKSIITGNGMNVAAVHPFTSFMEPYLLFSRYTRRFEDGRDVYRRYYTAAAELGASFVVMHGGRPGAHTTDEEYCDRFSVMREDAKEYGITLCQENVNGYRSQNPEFIKKMRRLMNDNIDFVFDVKQSVRFGCGAEAMLNAMGDRIVHLHLSDNSAKNDCMVPTSGSFDFSALNTTVKNVGYSGIGIIEVYSDAFADSKELINACVALSDILK